jgi:hypothetical protein
MHLYCVMRLISLLLTAPPCIGGRAITNHRSFNFVPTALPFALPSRPRIYWLPSPPVATHGTSASLARPSEITDNDFNSKKASARGKTASTQIRTISLLASSTGLAFYVVWPLVAANRRFFSFPILILRKVAQPPSDSRRYRS